MNPLSVGAACPAAPAARTTPQGEAPRPARLDIFDLSDRAFRVLEIIREAVGDGGTTRLSNRGLSVLGRCSTRKVQLGLYELEAAGWIARAGERESREIRLVGPAPSPAPEAPRRPGLPVDAGDILSHEQVVRAKAEADRPGPGSDLAKVALIAHDRAVADARCGRLSSPPLTSDLARGVAQDLTSPPGGSRKICHDPLGGRARSDVGVAHDRALPPPHPRARFDVTPGGVAQDLTSPLAQDLALPPPPSRAGAGATDWIPLSCIGEKRREDNVDVLLNSRGSGDPTTTDRPGGGSPPAEPIGDRIARAREALDGAVRRGEKTDLLRAQLDGLLRTRDRETASATPLVQALPPISGGGPDEGEDAPSPARPSGPAARRTEPSAGELAVTPGLAQRIGRLAMPGGMLWVETCVRQVVELWADDHSADWHRKNFQRVALGSMPLAWVAEAFELASGYTDKSAARKFYARLVRDFESGKAPDRWRQIAAGASESAARPRGPALVPVPLPVARRVEPAPAEEPALTGDDLAWWREKLASGTPAWRKKAADVLGMAAATA